MPPSSPDVLVLGSGIAGLSAALGAARAGASVTVATKSTRPEGASTWWAQGGIAVARQNPEPFQRDIETASSDTSDPAAVEVLTQQADAAVRDVLIDTLNVDFDAGGDGAPYDYGRPAWGLRSVGYTEMTARGFTMLGSSCIMHLSMKVELTNASAPVLQRSGAGLDLPLPFTLLPPCKN